MEKKHKTTDISILEEFNKHIQANPFYSSTITIKENKDNKPAKYQYFNLLATCVIRIRETTGYINSKELIYENICGQAFDFYEFINLSSIIVECIKRIFVILKIENKFPQFDKNEVFKISNKTKLNDNLFFYFIRSASSVHPAFTNRYRGKTKALNEFFPYLEWINDNNRFLFRDCPKDCNLVLKSWNSRTNSTGNNYYLKSIEFYDFLQCNIDKIKVAISQVEIIRNEYLKKICFKNIKNESSFKDFASYTMYLYKKIRKLHNSDDFFDAGLLVSSKLLKNELISIEFKNYIKQKIKKVVEVMLDNPESIEEANVFDDLNVLGCFSKIDKDYGNYIGGKFWGCLYRDVRYSILDNTEEIIKTSDNNDNDSYFVHTKLTTNLKSLYVTNEIEMIKTYEDLLFVTLQAVYVYWKRQGKITN